MRSISAAQVARCENATSKRCRCRCDGAAHGLARVDLSKDRRALRRAVLDRIPPGDAHSIEARPRERAINFLDDLASLMPPIPASEIEALTKPSPILAVLNGALDRWRLGLAVGSFARHEQAPGKRFEVVEIVDNSRVRVRRADGKSRAVLLTRVDRLHPAE